MNDFIDNKDDNSDKTPILLHPAMRLKLLEEGQKHFNEERFFEAHESWETLWKVEQGRDRDFIQALILVAGHFVHVQKGNTSGAQSLAIRAKSALLMPPAHRQYRSLDTSPLISALDYNMGVLARHTEKELPPIPSEFLIPKLF